MSLFKDSGLSPEILKAIDEMGFIEPTPIQAKTIPFLHESTGDMVALAQTGTGKTAAFGLPILNLANMKTKEVQAVILCPTRELCIQIAKDLENFSKYIKGFRVVSVYGGAPIFNQIKALKKGAQVVVGTPGRTLDLIKRKELNISSIQWMVFDEADEMLNMGFKDDLDAILAGTPKEKQTLLFSATMPKEIIEISRKYMSDAKQIEVGKRNEGAQNVEHHFYVAHARDRYLVLKRLADMHPNIYGIVFCRTRQETKDIAAKLINDGYNADALHGDLSQAQRDHVMDKFRANQLHLLIATDVAARGLDVNNLTHVINYNLPDDPEVYIHRSGRTGRAGKSGISIAIVHTRELRKIKDVERMSKKTFHRKRIPDGKEICQKQLFNLIDKVERVDVQDSQIDEFLPVILKKLEWLDRDSLIKHFVSVEFNRFLEYYKDAPDLNVEEKSKPKKEKSKSKSKGQPISYSRFFINVGSSSNLTVPKMIGLINDNMHSRGIEIGKIDIMKKFSFFEIDSDYESDVIKNFRNAQYERRSVAVELSKPDPKEGFMPKNKRKKKPAKRKRNK